MSPPLQMIRIGRQEFVLVPAPEYRLLVRRGRRGERDAVEFAREAIGRDLARKRKAAGLSQAAVAARAGIRAETISRLESGRGNPTLATIRKILTALGEDA